MFYFFLIVHVDVIDDYPFDIIGQVWHGFAKDTVHQRFVQYTAGAIHEIGKIDGCHTVFCIYDTSLPKFIQGIFVAQAGNQLLQSVHGLYRIAVEGNPVLDFQHIKLRLGGQKTVARGLDAVDIDVIMNEFTAQPICNSRCHPAAAKEICDYHSLVAAGINDTFKQGFRLLSGVIYTFISLGIDGINICP
ncbi:hypothetical protein EVA_09834 [gut metagenome]|uniref:Uncharacterized protein n=1 Tax=gut metagenome TaxID=749906 RepID=J9GQ01_9ZZZZ